MGVNIYTKDTGKFLIKAVFYSIVPLSVIIFVFISGWINNMLGFAAVLISIVVLLKGYLYFFDVKECKGGDYTLKIENDILYINEKPFNLKDKCLFVQSQKCDEYFKVFLYDDKMNLIFKAVFDENEYIGFLKIIKPYKKLPLFLERTDGIFLCKEGFAINGREFFYDEVKSIEWEIKKYRCKFFSCSEKVVVSIILKNGQLADDEVKKTYVYKRQD